MTSAWQPALIALLVGFAICLRLTKKFRGYQFTAWIVVAVAAAMIYPAAFLHLGNFDLRSPWLILIVVQLVMFGMGTQMSIKDFAGVVQSPRGVFVGVLCRFTVMPLVGYALIKIFHFQPEIAAGVILIGSCSSGLASNVMAYLAQSNLALSVTITAMTTIFAVVFTPFWMKVLAGTLVEVKPLNMMFEIIKIVVIPIGAAMLHDYLKFASSRGRKIVFGIAVIAAAWIGFLIFGGWNWMQTVASASALSAVSIGGFLLGAVLFGNVYHQLTLLFPQMDKHIPVLSMAGIIYFTAVTTAAGRDNLLSVGALLFLVAILHNTAGYALGYWVSRAAGLDKNSARSVAFEVGIQNGGMASGLAGAVGKLGTMGLAAAIFSPWMNISGSILANYWRKRPVK
ncbi:MAG TPA: bile acid:sodium symporter family protein [Pseudomonadales bacterium]|nr:bile acid:sodium symporter family protein [Pseudomonadales bacterium]